MNDTQDFYYEANPNEQLSTEVVNAIAKAHDEDIIEQKWHISDDIDPDSLDGLFQSDTIGISLQFEADTTTVTIISDTEGDPHIRIESHR